MYLGSLQNAKNEKVILRNSIKSNFEMLTISIVLVIITLYINTIYKNTILSIVFCIIIVLIPLLKIVNQKPKLIISKESIIFSNGKQVKWREIADHSADGTSACAAAISAPSIALDA